MTKRIVFLTVLMIFMGGGLLACRNDGESTGPRRSTIVVDSEPETLQAETRVAQTLIALTPTEGPSPTATITSTPYASVTPMEGEDLEMVVAEVYGQEITLAEFQARTRYERWWPLYGLARRLPREPELLDLTRPENATILSFFYDLNRPENPETEEPESIGGQVIQNVMLTEAIAYYEATLRDLNIPQTAYDGMVARRIGVELGQNGVRPDNWDEAYSQYIEDMETYTGMTESDFQRMIQSQIYYDLLQESIIADRDLPRAEVRVEVEVQDLLVDSRDVALIVLERLLSGAEIETIASDLGFTSESGEFSRTVQRGEDNGLTEEIEDAVFNAGSGDVIGPFPTDNGWYVARILEGRLDMPQPVDVEALREEAFLEWIREKLDNPDVVILYDNWYEFIPYDPMPQDVSPLMRTENFTVPDDLSLEDTP